MNIIVIASEFYSWGPPRPDLSVSEVFYKTKQKNVMSFFHQKTDPKYYGAKLIFLDNLQLFLHCKCRQGITGTLQGNRSAGISNLWGLHVYLQSL